MSETNKITLKDLAERKDAKRLSHHVAHVRGGRHVHDFRSGEGWWGPHQHHQQSGDGAVARQRVRLALRQG